MASAIATGTVLSAPLLMNPCASSVPTVRITVLTFAGTSCWNSFQLRASIDREEGCWAPALARKKQPQRNHKSSHHGLASLERQVFAAQLRFVREGYLRPVQALSPGLRSWTPGAPW